MRSGQRHYSVWVCNLLAEVRGSAYLCQMLNPTGDDDGSHVPQGVSLLASDLTACELSMAPTLKTLDTLVIEELTDHEDDVFDRTVARSTETES